MLVSHLSPDLPLFTTNVCYSSKCSIEFDRDDELFATAGVSKRIKVFEFSSVSILGYDSWTGISSNFVRVFSSFYSPFFAFLCLSVLLSFLLFPVWFFIALRFPPFLPLLSGFRLMWFHLYPTLTYLGLKGLIVVVFFHPHFIYVRNPPL
jgi:hypothetical protein